MNQFYKYYPRIETNPYSDLPLSMQRYRMEDKMCVVCRTTKNIFSSHDWTDINGQSNPVCHICAIKIMKPIVTVFREHSEPCLSN